MVKCKYEGTGIWNGRCTGTKEIDPCTGYDKCKQYKPNYTTNADRIRSMSDFELAKEIENAQSGIEIKNPKNINYFDCILEWLQQPAEENDYGV